VKDSAAGGTRNVGGDLIGRCGHVLSPSIETAYLAGRTSRKCVRRGRGHDGHYTHRSGRAARPSVREAATRPSELTRDLVLNNIDHHF
jgi:hypothetical protein